MESIIEQPNIFSMSKLCFPSMHLTRNCTVLTQEHLLSSVIPQVIPAPAALSALFSSKFWQSWWQLQLGQTNLASANTSLKRGHPSTACQPHKETLAWDRQLFPPKNTGMGNWWIKSSCRCSSLHLLLTDGGEEAKEDTGKIISTIQAIDGVHEKVE